MQMITLYILSDCDGIRTHNHLVCIYLKYIVVEDINGVIKYLENMSRALFEWFGNNLLKSNTDKYHRLVNLSIKLREYDASRHRRHLNIYKKLSGVKQTSFKRL